MVKMFLFKNERRGGALSVKIKKAAAAQQKTGPQVGAGRRGMARYAAAGSTDTDRASFKDEAGRIQTLRS